MAVQQSRIEEPPADEWLTAAEAANYLRIKRRTLLFWVRQGKLQAFGMSGIKRHIWRFRRVDLDRFLLAHPVIPSPSPTVLPKEGGTV
jgi:excisionase family DNA binding protein